MVNWADFVFWPWAGGVLASMGGLSGRLRAGRRKPRKLTVSPPSRRACGAANLSMQVTYPRRPRKARLGSRGRASSCIQASHGLVGDPRQAFGFAEHGQHVEDAGRGGAAGER